MDGYRGKLQLNLALSTKSLNLYNVFQLLQQRLGLGC